MKSILVSSALAALLFAAAPAVAQAPAAEAAPTAKLDAKDPNAVRCRRLSVTGSLVKKDRICKTNAEWQSIADQQRRDGTDLIERSRAGMNPNG